jgi:hypothetical protein
MGRGIPLHQTGFENVHPDFIVNYQRAEPL